MIWNQKEGDQETGNGEDRQELNNPNVWPLIRRGGIHIEKSLEKVTDKCSKLMTHIVRQ
jgi:hypothetical protein